MGSFEWVLKHIRPGVTEQEIVGGAEGFLRARGAEDSLVLIRAEKPHTFITRAQNKPIRPNEVFIYSCEMAGPGGYWTQMVRPIFLERGCAPEAYEVLQVIRRRWQPARRRRGPETGSATWTRPLRRL